MRHQHDDDDCFQVKKRSSEKIGSDLLLVIDRLELNALIDIGADYSVIRYGLAKKLKF